MTWDTVELSRELFYSDDPPHPGEMVRRGATITLTYRWADGRRRSFARCLRDLRWTEVEQEDTE